jgi:hypothetical protein
MNSSGSHPKCDGRLFLVQQILWRVQRDELRPISFASSISPSVPFAKWATTLSFLVISNIYRLRLPKS